ncbi:16S rRNA (adenine(1518)-N(6)/adenine(1519)-N(6))-dimethyltransferase RsmA [Anoxynatronum buryatiense]|uniref:Ribosomal RNA small subunit methyltransferase A n=1 Tax=Anoxynatronum buryatiense TaxID=489973 RepID=A0AA46AJ01_9CLOT|nr:16S rRNA (adenine(1518)-N(6)/adenine(1519)-N(6))-dimethyltransferase RsmA [Anoxynatronum buryatiense]SMP56146.1 16S rRNA (adenine1518-N6/adenine1519-N6)-dimethyltransferase [Anoxynatronum buryatiense]
MTPMEKIRLLQQSGSFQFTKSLGQNFLTDENILRKMAVTAKLTKADAVIEIGPGAGIVTEMLLQEAGSVLAVEIDKSLIPFLQETLGHYPHFTLWHQDVLKANLAEWITAQRAAGFQSIKVVGNLPYYVTTPIIMKLLEDGLDIDLMLFMIQKEVAQRLAAKPGTKDYGALTVGARFYCEAEKVFDVSPQVFIPRPKVASAVVRLTRHETPPADIPDPALFFQLVRAAFGQRRKTLLNALGTMPDAVDKADVARRLNDAGIDANRRGETLSIEEFARLASVWPDSSDDKEQGTGK